MGKGDKRTRRGKIYRGSFGKSRPKVVEAKSPKRAPAKAPASAPTRSGSRTSTSRAR